MADQAVCRALDFARAKHAGQYRFGGSPYIVHPKAVAEDLKRRGYGRDYYIAALFHDLLEDTDAAEAEIEAIGGLAVLRAVKLLTKPKPCEMGAYLEGIAGDPVARAVKCADRLDNLRNCGAGSVDFQKKYYAESIRWYRPFMAGTPFEGDFEAIMSVLEKRLLKKQQDCSEKVDKG